MGERDSNFTKDKTGNFNFPKTQEGNMLGNLELNTQTLRFASKGSYKIIGTFSIVRFMFGHAAHAIEVVQNINNNNKACAFHDLRSTCSQGSSALHVCFMCVCPATARGYRRRFFVVVLLSLDLMCVMHAAVAESQ
jgi:hypothetical protein